MPSPHPDPGKLEGLAVGHAQGASLLQLLEHLAAWATCRSRFSRSMLSRVDRDTRAKAAQASYDRALERAAVRCRSVHHGLREAQQDARGKLRHLLGLPEIDRRRQLAVSPHLRSYTLARELLQVAERTWGDDAGAAEKAAGLALLVADHLSSRTYGKALLEDLRAEGWSFVANARRIRSDFCGAAEAFHRAEYHQRRGSGDAVELARVTALFSTFLRDCDDLDAARGYLDHAITLYRHTGSRHLEARALISKWVIEWFVGDYDAGMILLDRAARWIEPGREPRLAVSLAKNRALALSEIGGRSRVRRSIQLLQGIEESGHLDRLRTTWARGRLLVKLEQPDRAESAFLTARRGFGRARIPIDIASLDLDLGRLYLSMGRIGEARRRASSAFPSFAQVGLHRETLRALDVFRQAGGLTA